MLITKDVRIRDRIFQVTISDDRQALQAAYAAGGAVVGLWGGKESEDLSPALYLVEDLEDADEELLRKAVCRRYHMPFEIAETERLIIREFRASDMLPPEEKEFSSPELLSSYIACQYGFYECGLWALAEKKTGEIVGKAGITDGELGYEIYQKFRRKGFAEEACRAILSWAEKKNEKVCLRTHRENKASIALACSLGFLLDKEEGEILLFQIDLSQKEE